MITYLQKLLIEDLCHGHPRDVRDSLRAELKEYCGAPTHSSQKELMELEQRVTTSRWRPGADEIVYFARFLKKFKDLPPLKDDQAVISEFISRQSDVLTGFTPGKELDDASRLTRMVTRSCRVDVSDCHHGPGATAEGLQGVDKALALVPTSARSIDPLGRLRHAYCEPVSRTKITVVPKDWRGGRVIGVEPVWNMARQLALKSALERISPFIPYKSQDKHRRVLTMSGYQDLVTADLSNASDHISVSAAEFMLDCDTFRQAMGVRTDTHTVRQTVGRTESFALMGNGFCFPVLSIIVWSLGVVACLHAEGRRAKDLLNVREAQRFAELRKISCFGDDLILPAYGLPFFRVLTAQLGLKINEAKCGVEDFRETCGIYRFLDRNPFRCHYLKSINDTSSEGILGLCELQNQLFLSGHQKVAEGLAKHLDVPSICFDHYSGHQSGGFKLTAQCNCKRRWNKSLQRVQFQVYAPKVQEREVLAADCVGWWQAFHGGIPLTEPSGSGVHLQSAFR